MRLKSVDESKYHSTDRTAQQRLTCTVIYFIFITLVLKFELSQWRYLDFSVYKMIPDIHQIADKTCIKTPNPLIIKKIKINTK